MKIVKILILPYKNLKKRVCYKQKEYAIRCNNIRTLFDYFLIK